MHSKEHNTKAQCLFLNANKAQSIKIVHSDTIIIIIISFSLYHFHIHAAYGLTIYVPVVFMARNVMVLMRANPLQRSLEGGGS
jgi:hypothetical protein